MKEISIRNLARMVGEIPVNGNIYVKQNADSELFGITCLNLFDSDLIIISHFGGGFASLFDTSTSNEEKELCSWLQYALGADNNEKIVYLLTGKEVYGEQTPRNDSNDTAITNKSSVSTFITRIINLRDDIIANIASILKENNLSKIELDGMAKEPTFVLWCDDDGNWYDSPVKTVSLDSQGISIDVEDEVENVSNTLYSKYMDVAFKAFDWLEKIRGNVLEAVQAKKLIKNDTQLSIFKEWNYYLKDNNGEEPRYAHVSLRFKDDNSEGEQIISLTDYSEDMGDSVFHYVRSLQELIGLADTDKEATMENFIITRFNKYSDIL
ncbi:MAG: hypothetical protein LUD40_07955 [Phocaeicola dorei]|nr:hypothetical protein [Phocaeicola dorei]